MRLRCIFVLQLFAPLCLIFSPAAGVDVLDAAGQHQGHVHKATDTTNNHRACLGLHACAVSMQVQ